MRSVQQVGRALPLLVLLTACAVARTPADLKAGAPPMVFAFTTEPSDTLQCFVPELDKITPFTFPPDDTSPPSVRQLGGVTQIIATDDTIALYLIELQKGARGTDGAAFVNGGNYPISPQIVAAINACNGTVRQ